MNTTALITGASGGIGLEFARILAGEKNNLILVARSKDKLDDLKKELEGKHNISVFTIYKDLSHQGAAKEVYDELKEKGITIDYLINNAGFGDFGFFAESDWNKQEQMINVNVIAVTHFTRLFLPDMICRRSGKILNVASTASFQPGPMMSVYFATKAFVLNFSQAIDNEVREYGITVTALCPGSTKSEFHNVAAKEGSTPPERNNIPSANEVAEYGYRAMMEGKTVAIHGFKNSLLANLVRFGPRSLVVKMARRTQEKKY
jgi:uncharacterized protein